MLGPIWGVHRNSFKLFELFPAKTPPGQNDILLIYHSCFNEFGNIIKNGIDFS